MHITASSLVSFAASFHLDDPEIGVSGPTPADYRFCLLSRYEYDHTHHSIQCHTCECSVHGE